MAKWSGLTSAATKLAGRTKQSALLLLPALCLLSSVLCPPPSALAATFPGNAGVVITGSTGLTWNNTTNSLTVQCWFKLSVPSGVSLTDNMSILVNRRTGTASDVHAYNLWYDKTKGTIEFSTRWGTGASYWQGTVISTPYPERWYHVAIVRSGIFLSAYVDGIVVPTINSLQINGGNAATTDGVSIGSWGSGKYLYGEVQEVSIYQGVVGPTIIRDYMFKDQDTNDVRLKGYFKLGFSQNPSDRLRNLASAAPANTDGAPTGSGRIAYEETSQAGEQSSFDANRNGGAGAIAPLSGSFSWGQTVLARPTPGIPFNFQIGYGSASAAGNYLPGETDPALAGPLGNRWRHSFETRVLPMDYFGDSRTIGLMMWNGSIETWDRIGDSDNYQTRRKEYRGEFFNVGTNHQWVTPERLVYTFRARDTSPGTMRGRLTSITDSNHNQLLLQYKESTGELTNIVDTAGEGWTFSTGGGYSLLQSVSFGAWSVQFAYDANQRLISKTLVNTSGLYTNVPTIWQFKYYTSGVSSNLLQAVVDPLGRTNVVIVYDEYGRRTNTVDALGYSTRVEYSVPGKRQITTTDAEGYKWIATNDRKGRVIAQQDPLGNVTRYTYDEQGNRTSVTDPLGNTTLFAYDTNSNVIAITNALSEVTRRTYHSFFNKPLTETDALGWTTTNTYDAKGNLLSQRDAMGLLASYTYTTNGLVWTATDANGHTETYAYNADGFLVSKTDAANYTTRSCPNEVGWNLAETNALGEVTTYAYDLNGKTVLTLDPLGRSYAATYDANGNLLTQTDAKGRLMRYGYDVLNQKTNEVDRAGATNRFTYTPRGKPASRISALNQTNTVNYDAANRQISTLDALGNVTSTVYDANGNAIATIDPLGQRWTTTYDRLNRAVAQADPFARTARTEFDAAGRVRESIAPDGSRTINSYDGRGRLTNWVDAAGSNWRYAYDAVGNITNITDALGGRYVMEYGPRDERTLERNQDGKVWNYTYDALGRLKTQHEPNGNERTIIYDEGGRITAVNFNTGRINSFLYDDNDNPVVLSRSGSGPATISQLAYDDMDRVQQYTDAFAKTLRYTYDLAGRMTSLTYPDGKTLTNRYDTLDRLTNQVFQFNVQTFTTSYAYDRASRLVRRAYPNGIVQTNTFDNAGRLTGLSHSGPSTLNIALNYAYDRNGNTIRADEKGLFQWPMPALRNETAGYRPSGQLIDRQITLSNQLSTISYLYDASGNMTNCVGGGQDWTLTYDEDNRSTSMRWDPGFTAKTITNRYDAFGRRIAKSVDGIMSGYVLDVAGGMERVLCDLNAARAITAWYVHGADLSFKVAPDGSLTCYHADAQGNIIALTDGTGSTVAEYAYTPYGRSLGSTNSQPSTLTSQPYLFVGGQGVMAEEQGVPGLYFMRARYYSADAGVFLSTDPVQNIGPSWQPTAYVYVACNPLKYSDPEGEWLNFVVGAVVGGGLDLAFQTLVEGKSLDEVNWGSVAGSAVAGALTGGISSGAKFAALQGGKALLANIALGAATSAIGKVAEIGLESGARALGGSLGSDASWGDVGNEAITGGIFGGLSSLKILKGTSYQRASLKQLHQQERAALRHARDAGKLGYYPQKMMYARQAGGFARQQARLKASMSRIRSSDWDEITSGVYEAAWEKREDIGRWGMGKLGF